MRIPPYITAVALFLILPALGGRIEVVANPDEPDKTEALAIVFPDKILAKPGQNTISYKILNRTRKHIFVVIRSRNVEGWESLKVGGRTLTGGGRSLGKASSHENLRLLYAPRRLRDGTIEDVLTSQTTARVSVACGSEGGDLSDWAGASGILNLPITFYVESADKRETVRLRIPIKIEKAEQDAAGQPATRSESK